MKLDGPLQVLLPQTIYHRILGEKGCCFLCDAVRYHIYFDVCIIHDTVTIANKLGEGGGGGEGGRGVITLLLHMHCISIL